MLTIALASVPTVVAVLMGILINNARLSDLRGYMDSRFNQVDQRFSEVDRRFDEVYRRFDQIDRRFEETKGMWRAELRRVEDILDARLKHLEAR